MSFKKWCLGTANSLDLLQIYPDFGNYTESINMQRRSDTSESGRVTQYKVNGGSFRYSFGLDFINSADVSQITAWWQNQDNIVLSEVSSVNDVRYTVQCRVDNKSTPFDIYEDQQTNLFNGSLVLLSTKDYLTARGIQRDKSILTSSLSPLILDNPIAGALDSQFYVLN